jgi:predicted transcriptional regulator
MDTNTLDPEFIILETIYASQQRNPPIKQRELAQTARTSLGMTNSILKRLVQKGWIAAKKINSRNIQYTVTVKGSNEINRRSYGHFKHAVKNVAFFKDTIDKLIQNAAENKANAVLLIGASDLEFIIEHSCQYFGLSFLKSIDRHLLSGGKDKQTLVFLSENIPVSREPEAENWVFLSQLLIKNTTV